MATDCIIENWVKKNKSWLGFLLAITVVWGASVVGIITIKHYYTGLSWQNSRISLSNALSLGSAIGAIAVAVFGVYGVLTYKNATTQHLRNEFVKLKFEKIYGISDDIITGIAEFSNRLLELKSQYSVLRKIKNTRHQDSIILANSIIVNEKAFIQTIYENILQLPKLLASDALKLIPLGINEELINEIEGSVKSYNAYLMSLSKKYSELTQASKENLSDVKFIENRYQFYEEHYKDARDESGAIALKLKGMLDNYIDSVQNLETT